MVDQIYSLFTLQDIVLFISVFINLGLFINHLDKKFSKKKGR